MILIVGLGNPGAKYARNRHNAGFQAIDAILAAHPIGNEREKFKGHYAEGTIGNQRVGVLKPQTFYNESGNAVAAAARFHKISPENIIVFHDEIDLAPGKIRVKLGGGLAGNNGLRSTSAHMGPDFWRVRIGVGHPGRKEAVMPHVLSDFSKTERVDWFDDLICRMANALPQILPPTDDTVAKFMSAVMNVPKAEQPRADGTAATRSKRPVQKSHAAPPKAPSPQATSPFADALKGIKPDET